MQPECEYRYDEISYADDTEICFDLYNGEEHCVCKKGSSNNFKFINGLNKRFFLIKDLREQ